MTRVRATDPRPCPKCGKIYRSAHTLRTHLEDKHTVCSGYRCVLCGTVAKSRNSLHSHMSRQHRGISTKDLPVQPMPSNFDPELASNLLLKAGVKVRVRGGVRPEDFTGSGRIGSIRNWNERKRKPSRWTNHTTDICEISANIVYLTLTIQSRLNKRTELHFNLPSNDVQNIDYS